MVEFDAGRLLLVIGLIASFTVILTGQAAQADPRIQDITGYTPLSETAACQTVGGQVETRQLVYDTQTEWEDGTNFSYYNDGPALTNTTATNGILQLDGTNTSGTWREGLLFDEDVTVTQIEIEIDHASVNEKVVLETQVGGIFVDPSQVRTFDSPGTYTVDVNYQVENNVIFPNEKLWIDLELNRSAGGDPTPEIDYIEFSGEEPGEGFISQTLSGGRCTLNQAGSYIGILFTDTGNIYLNAVLNILGLLMIVTVVLIVKEIIGVLPFLGN